jgi:hypothetical protein
VLKLIYEPAVMRVELPGIFLDSFRNAFQVANPDFDANHDDPDEVSARVDFFDAEERRLPTGLAPAAMLWAKKQGIEVELVNWPYDPNEGWLDGCPQVDADLVPGIHLKDFQLEAVRKALRYGCGVLEIATGGGKTEIAIAITIALGKPKTIFMVPDRAALYQMRDRFLARGFAEEEVGRLGDGLYEIDRPILVAIVNSLYSGVVNSDEGVLDRLTDIDIFFADEVHHQATAMMWKIVAAQCAAPRRYGLSGTPYKDDRSRFAPTHIHPYDTWLTGLLGKTLIYIPAEKLQKEGKLANCEMRIFPAGGEPVVTSKPQNKFQAQAIWRKVYNKGIVENDTRNERVALLAANLADQCRHPLISVERLPHGRHLQKRLWELGVTSVCSYGAGVLYVPRLFAEEHEYEYDEVPIHEDAPKKRGKKKAKPKVVGYEDDFVLVQDVDIQKHLLAGELKVLIGSRIYDEALDIPFLTDLINASGGKAPQRFRQKVGRVLRLHEGKGKACIWDPWDETHGYLLKHSRERAKTAAAQGFPVSTDWKLYEAFWTYRVADLAIGDVIMKNKELEITVDLTIPVGGKDKYVFVKPRVTLRAEIDEDDSLPDVARRLSADAKAIFVLETCKQARTLNEIMSKGFEAAAKEYFGYFDGKESEAASD